MWCRNLPRTLQQQTPLQGQRRKHSWKNVRANTQTQWCGQDRNLILMKTCGCWVLISHPGVRYWSTIGRIIRVSSFERIVTNSFDRCSSTKWYVQHPHSWILLYTCVSSFFQSLFSLRSFPPLVLAASYCAAKSSQFHSTLLPAIANNVNSGGNLVFLCICPSGALCLVFRLPLFQPDIVSDCSAAV